MRAQVLTPWTNDVEHGNYPLLQAALVESGYIARNGHPWSMVDVTGQPAENLYPDPNLYIVEVTCDATTLAAIEADDRFMVLWSEDA